MMTLLFVAHFVNASNDFKVRLFSENLKVEDWESISWTKDDKPYYLEGHDLMCTLKFIMASIFHKLTWFSINLDVDTQARGKTLLFQNLLIQIFSVFPLTNSKLHQNYLDKNIRIQLFPAPFLCKTSRNSTFECALCATRWDLKSAYLIFVTTIKTAGCERNLAKWKIIQLEIEKLLKAQCKSLHKM